MNKPIGKAGLELIKKFEGCRLTAYQDSVKVWTIGYGHTGTDVYKDLKITPARAEELLKADCDRFAKEVDNLNMDLNDNQRDALISFSFNCGAGNLRKLCKNRTVWQIAEHITEYNKAGGKILPGLTRRRKAEKNLLLMPMIALDERGITMTQYEKLIEKIEEVRKELKQTTPVIYHYTSSLPSWARSSVQKALNKKYIMGFSDSDLNLSEDMIRMLVVLDRAGILG